VPEVPDQVFDADRLAAVQATGLLDTDPERAFDRLARLAATLLDAPFAFVTLVDDKRSFWKACIGVADGSANRENPVQESFCQYVIGADQPLIVDDAAHDPRTRDNPMIASMGVAAWAGFPIRAPGGEALGSFSVVDTRTRQWSQRDIDVLSALADSVNGEIALRDALAHSAQAAALAEARAQELHLAGERFAALARTLQESLLPPHLPDVPGVEVAARYLPAGGGADVVGDFYDVFQSGRSTWSVVIGDVCGKGVEAAKVTALARYTIRAAAMRQLRPSRILTMLNRAMLAQRPDDERFLTAAYASIRQFRGRVSMSYCSAGHTPALIRHATGAVTTLPSTGSLLGLFPDTDLRDLRLNMQPGDTLLLYTDGVTEARRGREQFGEERLVQLLWEMPGVSPAEVVDTVVSAVMAFTGGPTTDDTALLAVHIPA